MNHFHKVLLLIANSRALAVSFDIGIDPGMSTLKISLATRYYQMSADMPVFWEVLSFKTLEN